MYAKGCTSGAASPSDYCIAHGGGKRFVHKGCTTGASAYGNCYFHGCRLGCLADECSKHRIFPLSFARLIVILTYLPCLIIH